MSIPTSEIAQAEQDHLRDLVHGRTFGRLPESVRDRVVRLLHRYGSDEWTVRAYRTLLDPGPRGGSSRLPDLSEAQQGEVLDSVGHFMTIEHAAAARLAFDAIVACKDANGLSDAVVDAAVDVVAAPLVAAADASEDERTNASVFMWRGYRNRMGQLANILSDSAFVRMDAADKARLLRVLGRCHIDGVDPLRQLLIAPAGRFAAGVGGGQTPTLLTTDAQGGTLLAALDRIATQRLHADLGIVDSRITLDQPPQPAPARGRRTRVEPVPRVIANYHYEDRWARSPAQIRGRTLSDLLAEVAWPDHYINQDNRGTCNVTCILHRLAWQQPAEYARMAADLAIGGTTTLRNNRTASPPSDAFPGDFSTRSVSERLTQSALISYARANQRYRGAPVRYYNTGQEHRARGHEPDGFADGRAGLLDPESLRAANAVLLGGPFVLVSHHVPQRLIAHFQAHPNDGVVVGIPHHVVEAVSFTAPQTGRARSIRWDVERRPPPEPGATYWNPWGAALVIEHGGEIVRVHDGTVEPPSATPRRSHGWTYRTVDDTRALQRMSWAHARLLFEVAILPASAT